VQIGSLFIHAIHAVEDHFISIRRYQTYRMIGSRQDTLLRVSRRSAGF
jgi:hypothetical protein